MLSATVLFVITLQPFLKLRRVNSCGGSAHSVLLYEQLAVNALVGLRVIPIIQERISKNEVPILFTETQTAASQIDRGRTRYS
jgi:hypothetical protein